MGATARTSRFDTTVGDSDEDIRWSGSAYDDGNGAQIAALRPRDGDPPGRDLSPKRTTCTTRPPTNVQSV
jgi:hypothetical protein